MKFELNLPPELAGEIVSTLHRQVVERHAGEERVIAGEERVIVGVDEFFTGDELRVRVMSRSPGEKG